MRLRRYVSKVANPGLFSPRRYRYYALHDRGAVTSLKSRFTCMSEIQGVSWVPMVRWRRD